MKVKKVLLFLLLCTAFLINIENMRGAAPTASSILSPRDGYFEAYIVIPARATGTERYAADELAEHIKEITGTEILVIREKPELKYFGFYIGKTVKGGSYAPPSRRQYNGSNGFRIKRLSDGLVIAGGDDLSTLYGVYEFLEKYQGCAWFLETELGEIVPKAEGINIPKNLDETSVPDIPIRWMNSGGWALKNKMNVSININGHPEGVINKWNYHTYRVLVPDDKYFDDHPEYFSIKRGKRVPGNDRAQLCTTNPELIKLVTQHLIYELKRNPEINFISLTANDWAGYCLCEHCKKQIVPGWEDDRGGKGSGPVHIFNNEVARRLKKYCPDQFIKVGAYAGYLRYPKIKGFKPEDNLAIMFTPHIHYCHNHPITDRTCPYITDFMNEYYQWAENSKHIQIFAYECLFGWGNIIWPMVHILKKDMPEYHRTGVEQFFTQTGSQTYSYALNYYVASKMAWDSSLDVNRLIKEFCLKSYGKAASQMEDFHRFLEDTWENNPGHVAYYTAPLPVSMVEFYTPEVVKEAEQLLEIAEAVDADSLSKERIKLIRTEFDYLRLILNYIDAISEPYKKADMSNDKEVYKAAQEAASIGKILSEAIIEYFKKNMPEEVQRGWPYNGMLRAAGVHNIPYRTPAGPERERYLKIRDRMERQK